jgi:hypothetical protein
LPESNESDTSDDCVEFSISDESSEFDESGISADFERSGFDESVIFVESNVPTVLNEFNTSDVFD